MARRGMLILLFQALLFSGATIADECDAVLESVKTMRDAREYFRCVARQVQERAPAPEPASVSTQVPDGAIFAWDALIRDSAGVPTGGFRAIPYGWQSCNGENGTPDLNGRFLMGVDTISAAGETGGRAYIRESGEHPHAGNTGVTGGPDHSISCAGKCGGGRTAAHSHTLDISASGQHSHGTNLPPYYKIIYICKMAAP